jgi:hypothetical protein
MSFPANPIRLPVVLHQPVVAILRLVELIRPCFSSLSVVAIPAVEVCRPVIRHRVVAIRSR